MTKTDESAKTRAPGPGRGLAWAVAAFVVVLAIGGLYFAFSGDDGQVVDQDTVTIPTTVPAPGPISGPFLLDLGTGEQTPLAELFAGAYWAAASPDGTRLFVNILNEALMANLDGTDERRLDTPGRLNYYGGRWSPDGTKIVYQAGWVASSEVGDLFVEDLVSGEQTQVTDFEPTTARSWFIAPTFSGDGQNVNFHLQPSFSEISRSDVWSVPVTGGEPTLVMENAAQWVSLPHEELSGAFVRPASDTFQGSSIMLSTRDGPRTLVETEGSIEKPSASPDGSRIVYKLQGPTDADISDIYVVDVSSGEATKVAEGNMASWLDNDTLVVVVASSVG